jgi:hypothetical protein
MGQAESTLQFTDFQLGNYWIGLPAQTAKKALASHFPDKMVRAVSLSDMVNFARTAGPDPDRLVVLFDPQSNETLQVLEG